MAIALIVKQKSLEMLIFQHSRDLLYGAPGGTRTPDLQVRSLPFYPAKLQAHLPYYYTVNFKFFQVFFQKNNKDDEFF